VPPTRRVGQPDWSPRTDRQASTSRKSVIAGYFIPAGNFQRLIGYFLIEEVVFVHGGKYLCHIGSPWLEKRYGGDRKTVWIIPGS
jgi:hypothetical protein